MGERGRVRRRRRRGEGSDEGVGSLTLCIGSQLL